MRAAASTCAISASMNTDVTIPASANCADGRAQLGFLAGDVEAALGGDFVPSFRHEHRHFRLHAARDAEHFLVSRPFRGSA